MNLSTYIFILFGVSTVFYLLGYQAPMFDILASSAGTGGPSGQTIINAISNIFSNPAFLVALGLSAVAPFLTGGGAGFNAVFVVPLFLLTIFANLFILPSSYLFDANLPVFLRTFIAILFNLTLTLSIISFVKGGPT